jgi:hypothetical protein
MVLARHDYFQESFKIYNLATAKDDMVSDGFPVNSPAYREVAAFARNTPKVKTVVVGRLLTDYTHLFELKVLSAAVVENKVLAFDVIGPDGGDTTSISYTVGAGATPTTVATAIAALVNDIAGLTAVGNADVIECSSDAVNKKWYVKSLKTREIQFLDTTVDSALAADLISINEDYKTWWLAVPADPCSKARIMALAADIEAREKLLGVTTHDTITQDISDTTNVMYALNQAKYDRTAIAYSEDQGAGLVSNWAGKLLPKAPGSATWANWELSGVAIDTIPAGGVAAFEQNKGNWYESIGGVGFTLNGTVASGEFIDIVRGRDWFAMRFYEEWANLLQNADKIPAENSGIEQIVNMVESVFTEGEDVNFIAKDPKFEITYPKITDTLQADRLERICAGIVGEGRVAGAFHKLNLTIILGV